MPGIQSKDCGRKVFLTRYPCTEKSDGRLLDLVIGYRPTGMSIDNWNHLQSYPFGFVIFGPSSNPEKSLPEYIGESDLDGDLYHVFWDYDLIDLMNQRSTESDGDSESYDDNFECVDFKIYEDGKSKLATIVGSVDEEMVKVQVDKEIRIMNLNDIYKERNILKGIIDHDKSLVKVQRIINGKIVDSWEDLKTLKTEMPYPLADYAAKAGLLKSIGWRWANNYMCSTSMRLIEGHKIDGPNMIFDVRYDNGDVEPRKEIEMQNDAPDILYDYVSEKSLLQEWQEEYVSNVREAWYENMQDYSVRLKLLNDQDDLVSALCGAWKKAFKLNNMQAVKRFSQAYKKSLDLRKHGHDINLPPHLLNWLPKRLHGYVLND